MTSPAAGELPELAAIAADIADLAAFERWRAAQTDAAGERDAGVRRLAAAVRGDVLNAAVLIAAMTSLANGIEGRAPTPTERSALAVFRPTHSVYFQTAIERLMAGDVTMDECWQLQTYLARLSLAQRMSEGLAGRRRIPAAEAGDIDPEIHADAWRRACGATLAVVACLDVLVGDAPATGRSPRSALDLLRAAAVGGTPCLDPEGRVTVPGWAERRREGRLVLHVVASAEVGGRALAAIIRDASPSGLGLTLSGDVEAGEAITVRLGDGRRLEGRIAWSFGRRAGVRLEGRVEPFDLGPRR